MHVRIACAVLVAAFLSSEAGAQSGRRGSPDRGRTETMQRDEVTAISPNDQARLQLVNAHSALKLTPEQAPAWQAYENKVVGLLDDLSRGFNPPGGNALKQIDARVDVVRNRLAAMEDIAEAAAKLYGGLSEEQRGAADRLLPSTLPTLYSGAPMRAALRRGETGQMQPPK